MKRYAVALVLLLSVLMGVATSYADEASFKRQVEMLNPTVRIHAGSTSTGSGVIIDSSERGVFIITNHHVVGDLVKAAVKAKKAPRVMIRHWLFVSDTQPPLPLIYEGVVVAGNEKLDLALIKIEDPDWRSDYVAALKARGDGLSVAETAYSAGASIGRKPFITPGMISLVRDQLYHGSSASILASTPILPGNSGGGLWVQRGDKYVLAGINTMVPVAPGQGIISHMAYAIPIEIVRAFLVAAGLRHFAV